MVDDRKPLESITSAFDVARDKAAAEKLHNAESDHLQYEAKVKYGKIAEDDAPKIINKGRIDNGENSPQKKEQRRRKDQDYIVKVLNQMQERLAVLEQQMAERYIVLQAKYGEDAVGGMAAEFLGDQAAELRTEQERMEALAEHFLDVDGHIKPEFAGSDEALFIRDWYEANEIRPVLMKFDGRVEFTADEISEITSMADRTNVSAVDAVVRNTELPEIRTYADSERVSAHELAGSVKNGGTLDFGH